MASLQQVQQLAKQGNPKAIAALLNHSLKSEGVQAKVARNGDRLKVALIGSTPPAADLFQRVTMGLKRLNISDISQCNISAYQANNQQPVWGKSLTLAAPLEPAASATSQANPASPTTSTPKRSPQPSSRQSGSSPVKLSSRAFWMRGTAFLLSVSLIVHGSLRFLLTLETQLFGIHHLPIESPNTNIFTYFKAQIFGEFGVVSEKTLENSLLYLGTFYAASLVALVLGLVAMRYALQNCQVIARKLSLLLAIAPALFVLICIVSNPYLLLPFRLYDTTPAVFFHPVTGVSINRSFQLTLIFINLLLLAIGSIAIYRLVLRPSQERETPFWQELKKGWQQLWYGRKIDMLKLSAIAFLLLLLTNPGPVRHVKASSFIGGFGANPEYLGTVIPGSVIKDWLANNPTINYRTVLVCSWLGTEFQGPVTFGFAGHSYLQALPENISQHDKHRSRFDLLNPTNYF